MNYPLLELDAVVCKEGDHWEHQQQTFTEYLLILYVYKVGEFELENLKLLHL